MGFNYLILEITSIVTVAEHTHSLESCPGSQLGQGQHFVFGRGGGGLGPQTARLRLIATALCRRVGVTKHFFFNLWVSLKTAMVIRIDIG